MRREMTVQVERTSTLEVAHLRRRGQGASRVRHRTAAVGFSLVDQTKFVTAASEIARNTIDHGGGGQARRNHSARRQTRRAPTFEDQGPGITNIELAMQDGYSTGGGLGMGMPGSKRLSNEFYVESIPGKGTKVTLVRWKSS